MISVEVRSSGRDTGMVHGEWVSIDAYDEVAAATRALCDEVVSLRPRDGVAIIIQKEV